MSYATVSDERQVIHYLQFGNASTFITAAHQNRRTVSTNSTVMMLPTRPLRVAVGLLHENFTHELIQASREFIVHLAGPGQQRALVQCGTMTGQAMDKFDLCRFQVEPAIGVGAPLIGGCPVAVECRLEQTVEFDQANLLVGEIVNLLVDQEMQAGGKNPSPMIYNPSGIYQLGKQLIRGSDWLSPTLRRLGRRP